MRKSEFGAAEPYAHIVIDDFLTNEAAEALLAEFSLSNKWSYYNHYNERKMGLTNIAEFGAGTRKIVSELSSQPFLEFLESLTGFDRLLGDPDWMVGDYIRLCRRVISTCMLISSPTLHDRSGGGCSIYSYT